MALKVDKEVLIDTKKEHNANFGKNKIMDKNPVKKDEPVNAPGREGENNYDPDKIHNASQQNVSENTSINFQAEPEPQNTNEFKEKFEEYFKGMDGLIGGELIAGFVDGLKADFLFIHAKKNGVDLPKEAFLMDEKSKKFTVFLIDHAIKNKLFGVLEKYPLLAASGVIALSGLASYGMIQMLSKGKKETEDLKKQNEKMKTELERFKNAQVVNDLNEVKN